MAHRSRKSPSPASVSCQFFELLPHLVHSFREASHIVLAHEKRHMDACKMVNNVVIGW